MATGSRTVPSLPGCISQGKTPKKEALENIKEAIALYIDVLNEDGEPVPEDLAPIESCHRVSKLRAFRDENALQHYRRAGFKIRRQTGSHIVLQHDNPTLWFVCQSSGTRYWYS